MLTRADKQISPEVRKHQKLKAIKEKPKAATPTNPDRRTLAEHMAEVERQWKATTQMNLPVLRLVKTTNE